VSPADGVGVVALESSSDERRVSLGTLSFVPARRIPARGCGVTVLEVVLKLEEGDADALFRNWRAPGDGVARLPEAVDEGGDNRAAAKGSNRGDLRRYAVVIVVARP